MDPTYLVALILTVVWLISGAIVALHMRRAGHDLLLWMAIGVLLGPFAALLALDRVHHLPGSLPAGPHKAGKLDLLAAIDGSPDSVEAVRSALDLLSGRVSSLTLVTVLDYDSQGPLTGRAPRDDALRMLAGASAAIGFEPVSLELLFGRPSQRIAEFARETGMELIVVGAKGHGMTRALLGSVTSQLVGQSKVPVFVGAATVSLQRQATAVVD